MAFLDYIINKSRFIGSVFVLLSLMFLVLGKNRWQFYPIYILGIIYLILVLLNNTKSFKLTPLISRWIIGVGLLLLISSIFFIFAFPKESLPLPSGKFKVGTRIYDLEDKSRDEVYSENKDDKRKIKYQVWYPTEETSDYKRAKWINDGTLLTRQLASSMNMPAFMLDHTGDIYSNSYLEAPISNTEDKYPLVIISHGWKGFRELHTDYAEDLASNGFIVISIDHTYGSQMVKFKDGKVAYLNEDALSNIASPSSSDSDSNTLATTYGKDIASVIDDLEKTNSVDKDLKDKMDLDRIGLLGHSTGGGGDVYISLKDKRVKALMGLDAWVNPIESQTLKQGLAIPSLFLRSQQWSQGPNNIALSNLFQNSNSASLVQMNKTNHVDFSMSYMYSPLSRYVGFTGDLKDRLSSETQREIILKFFDEKLRSLESKDEYLDEVIKKYDFLEFVNLK